MTATMKKVIESLITVMAALVLCVILVPHAVYAEETGGNKTVVWIDLSNLANKEYDSYEADDGNLWLKSDNVIYELSGSTTRKVLPFLNGGGSADKDVDKTVSLVLKNAAVGDIGYWNSNSCPKVDIEADDGTINSAGGVSLRQMNIHGKGKLSVKNLILSDYSGTPSMTITDTNIETNESTWNGEVTLSGTAIVNVKGTGYTNCLIDVGGTGRTASSVLLKDSAQLHCLQNSVSSNRRIDGMRFWNGASLTLQDSSLLETEGNDNREITYGILNYDGKITVQDQATLEAKGGGGICTYGNNSSLDIEGGTVIAKTERSEGILSTNKIVIRNASVEASGNYSIYSYGGMDIRNSELQLSGGIGGGSCKISNSVVFQGTQGRVYGKASLRGDTTIPEGTTLEIPKNKVLTVPEGKELINNGTIIGTGTLVNEGTLKGSGTFSALVRNNGRIDRSALENVYFYSGDGTVFTMPTLRGQKPDEPVPAPVRTGYIFNNWKQDKEYVYSAVWTPIKYTIHFDANGGQGTVSDITAEYDTEVTMPDGSGLSKEGYTFAGWKNQMDGKEYSAESNERNLASEQGAAVTLHAVWSQNTHVIRYQYSDTVVGAPALPDNANGSVGDTYAVEDAPVLDGYTFSGWSTEDATVIGGAFQMPNRDVTFIGSWTKNRTPETSKPSNPSKPWTPARSSSSSSNKTFNSQKPVAEDKSDVNPFKDVRSGAYYYDAVLWAVKKEITTGTSATTFSPNAACKRGEMVTFLWRMAGSLNVTGEMPFSDVKRGSYYEKAVLWAYQNGITTGTSATTFSPEEECTRGQMAKFLQNMAKDKYDVKDSGFTDVKNDAYYASSVAWLKKMGITGGTTKTTFGPNEKCTRAQMVTFLWRYSKLKK